MARRNSRRGSSSRGKSKVRGGFKVGKQTFKSKKSSGSKNKRGSRSNSGGGGKGSSSNKSNSFVPPAADSNDPMRYQPTTPVVQPSPAPAPAPAPAVDTSASDIDPSNWYPSKPEQSAADMFSNDRNSDGGSVITNLPMPDFNQAEMPMVDNTDPSNPTRTDPTTGVVTPIEIENITPNLGDEEDTSNLGDTSGSESAAPVVTEDETGNDGVAAAPTEQDAWLAAQGAMGVDATKRRRRRAGYQGTILTGMGGQQESNLGRTSLLGG